MPILTLFNNFYMKDKKRKSFRFTLSCYLPFLQSDIYGGDFKSKLERMYLHQSIDYAKQHGYNN